MPTSYRVIVQSEAFDDLDAIIDYIKPNSPQNAAAVDARSNETIRGDSTVANAQRRNPISCLDRRRTPPGIACCGGFAAVSDRNRAGPLRTALLPLHAGGRPGSGAGRGGRGGRPAREAQRAARPGPAASALLGGVVGQRDRHRAVPAEEAHPETSRTGRPPACSTWAAAWAWRAPSRRPWGRGCCSRTWKRPPCCSPGSTACPAAAGAAPAGSTGSATRCGEQFDLILGSDILYERKQWEYLEPFWRAHLSHGGAVLLGEPGRQTGELFLPWIAARGWAMEQFAEQVPTRATPVQVVADLG